MTIAHDVVPAPGSDDIDYAHSETGIQRAEDLAASSFDHFMTTLDVARLDIVIGATCLVADLLAMIERHTGTSPAELVEQFAGMIARRLAAYEDREAGLCPACATMPETAIH